MEILVIVYWVPRWYIVGQSVATASDVLYTKLLLKELITHVLITVVQTRETCNYTNCGNHWRGLCVKRVSLWKWYLDMEREWNRSTRYVTKIIIPCANEISNDEVLRRIWNPPCLLMNSRRTEISKLKSVLDTSFEFAGHHSRWFGGRKICRQAMFPLYRTSTGRIVSSSYVQLKWQPYDLNCRRTAAYRP